MQLLRPAFAPHHVSHGILSLVRPRRGVVQDLPAAYQYFREAAEVDPFSMAMAADMLMRGAGVKPDYAAAFKMFKETEVWLCGGYIEVSLEY